MFFFLVTWTRSLCSTLARMPRGKRRVFRTPDSCMHFYSTISGSFQFVSEYPQVFCVDFFVSWCWHATYSFATRPQPWLALSMHPSPTLGLENVTQIFRKASLHLHFKWLKKKQWKKPQESFRRSPITIPLKVWPMAIIWGKRNTSFNLFPPHGCDTHRTGAKILCFWRLKNLWAGPFLWRWPGKRIRNRSFVGFC